MLNLVILLYRLVAIIDAYRVADYINAHAAGGGGPARPAARRPQPLSIAGLLAVLLVMSGSHVVVARYDMLALGRPRQRLHLHRRHVEPTDCDRRRVAVAGRLGRRRPTEPVDRRPTPDARARPSGLAPCRPSRSRRGTARTVSTSCSSARDQRPGDGTYNTDTLIVVSIDPTTKQVAMFSLPRDSIDVPLPPGPACERLRRRLPGKINSFCTAVRNRADLCPGEPARPRGYNGLKAILGNLYGLDIKYFVEVNFDGFKKVVDAMGGVTINVQVPVIDDSYPSRHRPPRPGLHPGRHPAHDRRPGARLRALAARLGRLRPRLPPAARPHRRCASRPTSRT